jgi:transcriptional regulator with XRE-family HTH domain
MKVINTIVKEKRLAANLTQVQLAELIGTANSVIGKWEQGVQLPSYDSLKKLAKVYGCSHLDLGPFAGDLRGQKFGELTVKSFTEKTTLYQNTLWECECSCGNIVIRSSANLKKTTLGLCKECTRKLNSLDLVGQTFGQLKVLSKTDKVVYGKVAVWNCQCSCGELIEASSDAIKYKKYPSCKKCKAPILNAHTTIMRENVFTDGTMPNRLQPDIPLRSNNRSGKRGVSYNKNARGKQWRAAIGFKSIKYRLGDYDYKEEAIAARETAERLLYQPYLEWLKQNKNTLGNDNSTDYTETDSFQKFIEWQSEVKLVSRK